MQHISGILNEKVLNQSFNTDPRGLSETYRLIIRTHFSVETTDIAA